MLLNSILHPCLPNGLIITLRVLLISGNGSEHKICPSFMKTHIPHLHNYPMQNLCTLRTCDRRLSTLLWLTHWGRDKMITISQTTFSDAFSWQKMYEFRLKFHWNLFLGFELIRFQRLVQIIMAWRRPSLIYWRIDASVGLNELFILRLPINVRIRSTIHDKNNKTHSGYID